MIITASWVTVSVILTRVNVIDMYRIGRTLHVKVSHRERRINSAVIIHYLFFNQIIDEKSHENLYKF